jgi:hypothetical protein
MLVAGSDFADDVIAFEGCRLGDEVFASFECAAVELVAAQGGELRLLGARADQIRACAQSADVPR